MIYLPNKNEKYMAILRNTYQKLILKNGIKNNYLKKLRTIYNFEALITKKEPVPVNLNSWLTELLIAVYFKKNLKGKIFTFSVKLNDNYLVDKKIFSALILNIAKKGNFIKIENIKGKTIIKSDILPTQKIYQITKKLNGLILKELKQKNCVICIPLSATNKKTREFENGINMIQNPLSIVNIYL